MVIAGTGEEEEKNECEKEVKTDCASGPRFLHRPRTEGSGLTLLEKKKLCKGTCAKSHMECVSACPPASVTYPV